ncbi:exosortase-associated EpsI family protein [Chloroflexota bacterium]
MREYRLLIGLGLLVLLLVLMFTAPEDIFGGSRYAYISTELIRPFEEDRLFMVVGKEQSDREQLNNFPRQVGDWNGINSLTSKTEVQLKEALGTDVVLLREYNQDRLVQPLFLLLVYGSLHSSFHAPSFCYPTLGYKIEDRGFDEVAIQYSKWYSPGMPKLGEVTDESQKGTQANAYISVNKLIVYKERDGEITERRAVLYFYLQENQLASGNVNMVRVSAMIPSSGPYDITLNSMKGFMGQVIPLITEPHMGEANETLISKLKGWGKGGYFLISVLFSIPLSIIFYPTLIAKIRRKNKR